jgi:hypothetical protein
MRCATGIFTAALLATLAGHAAASGLNPGNYLYQNQGVTSAGGRYTLTMQGDGRLVMKRWDGTTRWSAPGSGLQAVMQWDGNFVIYGAFGATWHTNTWGNPGSALSVQDDGNLVVYGPTGRPLWNIGVDNYTPDNPSNAGDVVGRDLDVPGLGSIGHIGVWDGSQVAEVVSGLNNAARFIGIATFKGATQFWGVSRPAIPSGPLQAMCFDTYCDMYNNRQWANIEARAAIQKRARQIQSIGADYTLVPSNTRMAQPRRNFSAAIRGLYRCDTFVMDVVGITRYRDKPNDAQSRWWRRLNSIETGVMLPATVYNQLASFR